MLYQHPCFVIDFSDIIAPIFLKVFNMNQIRQIGEQSVELKMYLLGD